MSCLQSSICLSISNANSRSLSLPRSSSTLRASASYSSIGLLRSRSERLGLVHSPRRSPPMCLSGGKGDSKDDSDSSSWKSLEKAMGSFGKEKSLEDVLRKQMNEQEFDGGGGLGSPPGSGGGDGSDEPEEIGFFDIIVEIIQVILGLFGACWMYIKVVHMREKRRRDPPSILSAILTLEFFRLPEASNEIWLDRALLRRRCVSGKLRELFESGIRSRRHSRL